MFEPDSPELQKLWKIHRLVQSIQIWLVLFPPFGRASGQTWVGEEVNRQVVNGRRRRRKRRPTCLSSLMIMTMMAAVVVVVVVVQNSGDSGELPSVLAYANGLWGLCVWERQYVYHVYLSISACGTRTSISSKKKLPRHSKLRRWVYVVSQFMRPV